MTVRETTDYGLITVRVRESALGRPQRRGAPVPIPNTEDKPACVSGSTGVGDPLGNAIRCPHSYHVMPSRYHVTFTDTRLR